MATPTTVNPSEETITIGPLSVRFLLTGGDTNGSVSVFEVMVPAGQKLAAPAHKNDAYEEVLYGIEGHVDCRLVLVVANLVKFLGDGHLRRRLD
jgi:hypothetical protein